MNNQIANWLFKASGYITGMHPINWLDKLEAMQWWDAERMHLWQKQELFYILQHATNSVPFYTKTLPSIDSSQISEAFNYLQQCPVLTKDQVRENFDAIQSNNFSGKPLENSTSGSTGKPLRLRVDKAAFARYFAAKLRALRWYDVEFADRQVRIWGLAYNSKQRFYWQARDLLQNRMRLISYDLSDKKLEDFFEKAVRFQPTYINGYTSAIYRVAQFINKSGKNGREMGVRLVLPTAEVLLEDQRVEIAKAFGCPVVNEYGGGEVQAIAYQCQEDVLHITHENMFVEVLDEQNQPVADGEVGKLTLTSFCNQAMPLIRYQNGDLVSKLDNYECACGRHTGLAVFERIIGRSSDILYCTDGTPAHWTVIYYAIKDAFSPDMIIEHKARQTSYDHIELQIITGSQYDSHAMENFQIRLRESLGSELQITLKIVDNIHRENSGKFRYFVSDIQDAQLLDG